MSRSGYSEDYDDQWALIRWRGAVNSATRGKRGQTLLRDLIAALDAMPEKRLIIGDLVREDSTGLENVCALGALGKRAASRWRLSTRKTRKPSPARSTSPPPWRRRIVYMNDEAWGRQTPEERWTRMRRWAAAQVLPDAPEARPEG